MYFNSKQNFCQEMIFVFLLFSQIKESMIKSGMQIAQSDFFVRLYKFYAGILAYFKENLCKMAENMQARCVPSRRRDLILITI